MRPHLLRGANINLDTSSRPEHRVKQLSDRIWPVSQRQAVARWMEI